MTARDHPEIRLIAAGDVCPGDAFCVNFGVGSLARRNGDDFPFQHVGDILREGDIVFGNCEGLISDIGADPKQIATMQFRGMRSFAGALRDAGFNVMTVANNHVGEQGPEALRDTVSNLRAAGIGVTGLRGDRPIEAFIQNVKGLRIGWLSYSWLVSKHDAEDRALLAATRGQGVTEAVAALRPEVDFLIVSPHWGREHIPVPPQPVIDQAHAIAEAGADLILGHHPHVVQGMERFGDCLIVYSLGNFLFDMWQSRLRDAALFSCTIRSGRVEDERFIPLRLNKQFQPRPATEAEAVRILRDIRASTRAISDPAQASIRDWEQTKRLEKKFKRWMRRTNGLHLIASVGRMGPRAAWQVLGRYLPARRRS